VCWICIKQLRTGCTRLSANGVKIILRPAGTNNSFPKYFRSRERINAGRRLAQVESLAGAA